MAHSEPKFAFPSASAVANAVAKAKASLPQFRGALEDGRCAGSFHGVKLHFPRVDGSEGQCSSGPPPLLSGNVLANH